MVSSKLSTTRGFLTRPKVCRPSPPSPPTPGLPERTCILEPDEFDINPEDEYLLSFYGCCGALPEDEEVTCVIDAEGGTINSPIPVPNCSGPVLESYYAPPDPGDYLITATFTWSDTGECQAETVAHVQEPP